MLLAGLDYAFQRWQYENDLKMTKQEVKEELKQREGDPTIKMRIKRAQIEMSQRRMMADVPTADVVITNPTRFLIMVNEKSQCNQSSGNKWPQFFKKRTNGNFVTSGYPGKEEKPYPQWHASHTGKTKSNDGYY